MRKYVLCHMRITKVQISLRIHGLISAFVVSCLEAVDSIISLDSIAEISRLYLASVAAQASLCLAGSEPPEDTLCRGSVQMKGDNSSRNTPMDWIF